MTPTIIVKTIDSEHHSLTADLAGYSATGPTTLTLQYSFKVDTDQISNSDATVLKEQTGSSLIDRTVTCRAVDTNGSPLRVTDVFHTSEKVYCVVHSTDWVAGQSMEFRWYRDKVEVKTIPVVVSVDSDGYVWGRYGNDSGLPAGSYRCEVYVGDVLSATASFEVDPNPP